MTRAQSIAFFMHDFAGGGVERMRLALAAAMVAQGYQVTIVVVSATGPLAVSVPEGVAIVDLACRRVAPAIVKLRHYVREFRPDVLISSLDHNNVAALLACSGLRRVTRLIICQHNALSAELRIGWRYRAIPLLYWILQRRADAIVAVSEGVADDLAVTAHVPRASISVIQNPVIEPSRFAATRPPAPHNWFQDKAVPVFVFAGRLVPQKDPLMLVEAFARFLKFRSARLIMLGDGPMGQEVRAAVERAGIGHSVLLAGFVAEPMPWIACADALLVTSRYEGFGNVIVEALACGTPVIATDCPHGPSEILDRGKFGVLVAPGDPEAFARAMRDDNRRKFPAPMLRARGNEFTVIRAVRRHEALFAQWRPTPHGLAFGLGFDQHSAADIAARVAAENAPATQLIVTPNLDHVRLLRSEEFRAACAWAKMVCADGWPVALYAGLRCALPWRRVTGCDILHAVLAQSDAAQRRVFAIVEASVTADRLRQWLSDRGWRDNWTIETAPREFGVDQAAQMALAHRIAVARPHILIMTLGAPVSEVFVYRYRDTMPPCWVLCVGQALRVELGLAVRAPRVWRRLGLEWAWRCAHEPRRLGARYLWGALWFPCAVLLDLARRGGFKQRYDRA